VVGQMVSVQGKNNADLKRATNLWPLFPLVAQLRLSGK